MTRYLNDFVVGDDGSAHVGLFQEEQLTKISSDELDFKLMKEEQTFNKMSNKELSEASKNLKI
jgi:hypothetical protein